MRRLKVIRWFALLLHLFAAIHLCAQSRVSDLEKIRRCLQDYQDFSALGRSGSAFVDETTINSFKNLFEMDANLFWDLFTPGSRRIGYLLTLEEYIDSVQRIYAGRKPVIFYGKHRIDLNASGRTAVVYLHKTRYSEGKEDLKTSQRNKTGLNLRIVMNIKKDSALIQNITEDTRLTRVRSLNVEGCFYPVIKVSDYLFTVSRSAADPKITSEASLENQMGYHAGMNADIRINRKSVDGLLINVGLTWFRTEMTATLHNYLYASRQAFDPGPNSFELTVSDRSSRVRERIILNGLLLPVAVKWYWTHRIYLKAGPQFSLLSGTSYVNCQWSHTGGGKVVLLNALPQQNNFEPWFYLDENHELDDARYGFFRNRDNISSLPVTMVALNVSFVFSAGVEARIGKAVIGIEPSLTLGLTNLTSRSAVKDYRLYPEKALHSFLETYRATRLNMVGIKLVIGKMFSR